SRSGAEIGPDPSSTRRLNWQAASPRWRPSERNILAETDLVDLRSMHLRHFRNQPKLMDQRTCFFVRSFPFERVPIDRLPVGDGLEQFVEIVRLSGHASRLQSRMAGPRRVVER